MYKFAIVQHRSLPGKTKENTDCAVQLIRQAAENGADLVLFPECFLTGYAFPDVCRSRQDDAHILQDPDFAAWRDAALTDDCKWLETVRKAAAETQTNVCITAFTKGEKLPQNTAFLLDRNGKTVLKYSKVHTCDFDAERFLEGGSRFCTGETDGYRLVWADYFNEGTLDRDNWNIEVNGDGGGNDELQYYTDRTENVSVGIEPATGKGCLIITARREDYQGRTCTSGRLTTQDKVYFTHGKVEASIKFPHTADGLWPAFWMMGNSYSEVGWPRCSETDIVEMGHVTGIQNGTQDRYFNGACHWGFYRDNAYPNYANHFTASYGLQDDFHLFTVYWDTESIRMYLDQDCYPDAEPYFQMAITDTSDDWATGNYFHKPNFILLNLAVGGRFPQIFNIDQVTALASGEASMYVDFVKVYQRGTADETFNGKPTTALPSLQDVPAVSVYPNPAVEVVYFDRTVQRVEVLGMQGNVVAVASGVNSLDVSAWQRGMYLLRLTCDGQQECVKLVVK